MRNNDDRKAYVRNEENWKVIDMMHYAVTKLLRYKGQEWIKICHLIEHEKYSSDLSSKVVKEMIEKGLYRVSEDGEALRYTNETEIVDKMRELDRLYPDKTKESREYPDPADTPRKGGGPVW